MERFVKFCFVATILSIVAFFSVAIYDCVKSVQFNRSCSGHLSRAANAATVETANQELSTAISFLEENHITSGYTSILYRTPDEDIEYWYNNLVLCKQELTNLSDTATTLEKTNLLMKVRETLEDNGQLIVPQGLHKYPYNTEFAIWYISFLFSFFLFLFLGIHLYNNY